MHAPQAEVEFHHLLTVLASYSRVELDRAQIYIYDEHLKPYGYAKASQAVREALINRRANSPMPSPVELAERIAPESSDRSQAVDIANKIISKISSRGYTWPETYQYSGHGSFFEALLSELGDAGAAVIRELGGWAKVCQETSSQGFNLTVFRSQLRDSAAAFLERKKRGAPSLAIEMNQQPQFKLDCLKEMPK